MPVTRRENAERSRTSKERVDRLEAAAQVAPDNLKGWSRQIVFIVASLSLSLMFCVFAMTWMMLRINHRADTYAEAIKNFGINQRQQSKSLNDADRFRRDLTKYLTAVTKKDKEDALIQLQLNEQASERKPPIVTVNPKYTINNNIPSSSSPGTTRPTPTTTRPPTTTTTRCVLNVQGKCSL